MRILVTGGAGFIGSHVTRALCDKKHAVVVFDDLRFGYEKFVDKRAIFIQSSLDDTKILEKALNNIDVVIHLAASSIISTSYIKPLEYFQNNLINGIKLLEAMRKQKVKKIIYSSTSSVYGQPTKIPITEETFPHPLTTYGSSKLAFEYALESYFHSFGIFSTSLRYYNAYGPHDEQMPRTRAIPMWIEAVLQNKPIPWYWQGKQKRDYIYVKDIADAHLAVLDLKGYNMFNIGSGKGIFMKDVLKTLEQIVGKKLKTKDMGERRGDPMVSYADITKIKKMTKWEPKVSLAEGLKETFTYFKKSYGSD